MNQYSVTYVNIDDVEISVGYYNNPSGTPGVEGYVVAECSKEFLDYLMNAAGFREI